MVLDDNFDLVDPASPSSWMLGASVGVSLQNTMVCSASPTAETFTLYGAVTRTLSLTAQGDPGERVTENTPTLSGTLEPPVCTN